MVPQGLLVEWCDLEQAAVLQMTSQQDGSGASLAGWTSAADQYSNRLVCIIMLLVAVQ